MLARAALAAVLVPLGLVCWMAMDEVRRCGLRHLGDYGGAEGAS